MGVSLPVLGMPGLLGGAAQLAFMVTTTGASENISFPRITPTGRDIKISWGDGTVDTIADGNTGAVAHTYANAGTYNLRISNPDVITHLDMSSTSQLSGDIRTLRNLSTSLIYLSLSNTSVSGDISAVQNLTSLTGLNLSSTSVSGDISAVQNLTSLIYLSLYNTSVSGDISAVQNLTSLTDLRLYNTSVSGDISAVQNLTSLIYLSLSSTSVSGDISAVQILTSLTTLSLNNTSVSGDISAVQNLTSLTTLRLYNTSVGYATVGSYLRNLTVLRNCQLQDCALTAAECDNVLEDIYAGRMSFTYATPSLNIGGTNAAPNGTYQAMCPPTTGKEFWYELVNDSCGDGFNKWTITANS